MANNVNGHYVTVVTVGELNGDYNMTQDGKSSIISIQTDDGPNRKDGEDITIYRLPGEKLGLGLKFEGGSTMTGIIQRLFIQSINKESPAAKIHCSWGMLKEGDEILRIQNVAVNQLSPLDCVNLLKDSSLAIKLRIKDPDKTDVKKPIAKQRLLLGQNRKLPVMPNHSISINFLDPDEADKRGFEVDHLKKGGVFEVNQWGQNDLPGWEGFSPPIANIYTDLIAEEERALSIRTGSESDETGSSVSTVIEIMSQGQGMNSLSRNSSFSDRSRSLSRAHSFSDTCSLKSSNLSRTQSFSESSRRPSLTDSAMPPTLDTKNRNVDLALVLSPFEQLERELDDADDIIDAPSAFDGQSQSSHLEPISEYISMVEQDNEMVTVSGTDQQVRKVVSTKLFVNNSIPPINVQMSTKESGSVVANSSHTEENSFDSIPRLISVQTKRVSPTSQPAHNDRNSFKKIEETLNRSNEVKVTHNANFQQCSEMNNGEEDDTQEAVDISEKIFIGGESDSSQAKSYEDVIDHLEQPQPHKRLVRVLSAVPKMESVKIQTLVDSFENQRNTPLLSSRFVSQDSLNKSDLGYNSPGGALKRDFGLSHDYLLNCSTRDNSPNSNPVTPVYYGSSQNLTINKTKDSSPKSIDKPQLEEIRKSNLNSLIQNRKKSISKLKGLVIPDVRTIPNGDTPKIIDLPQIKTCYQSVKLPSSPRVSLPVRRSSEDKSAPQKEGSPTQDVRETRLSVEQRYRNTAEYVTKQKYLRSYEKDIYQRSSHPDDESDGDSAVSSIGSGSGYSPPSSPADMIRKVKGFTDTSDEDGRSMLLSSSSSSSSSYCSRGPLTRQDSVDASRTSKNLNAKSQSIDNINRVSVIGASKVSSGLSGTEGAKPERSKIETTVNVMKKYRSESELGHPARKTVLREVIGVCTITDVIDGDPLHLPVTSRCPLTSHVAPVKPLRTRLSTAISLDTLPPTSETSGQSSVSAERWTELERKYSSSSCLLGPQSVKFRSSASPEVDRKYSHDSSMKNFPINSRTNFKALAQKWEKISSESNSSPAAPQAPVIRKFSRSLSASVTRRLPDIPDHPNHVLLKPRSLPFNINRFTPNTPQSGDDNGFCHVEKSGLCSPDSLVSNFDDVHLPPLGFKGFGSNSSSTDDLLEAFSEKDLDGNIQYSSDNRETFERNLLNMTRRMEFENGRREFLSPPGNCSGYHIRMSSQDSSTSEDSSIPTAGLYGSVSSLRDQFGSVTSLASSTSLISTQELQQLIDDANQSLEESGTPSHEIIVVVLHRENTMGGIGITLAGGSDYETKEITVHKVINGSVADRDGRILRGDRVLSINGRSLKGVTHKEALTILKAPRPEVVLVISRSRSVTPQEGSEDPSPILINCKSPILSQVPQRPPKILESPLDSKSLASETTMPTTPRGPPMTVILKKEGAGLGFSLEGGKDSPLGDRPLTVKKIFSGGVADKNGVLKIGDELISINNTDLTQLARIEAWNYMKKLPDGNVTLVIRKSLEEPSEN